MTISHHQPYPQMITRAQNQVLTLDVFGEQGVQIVPSSATLTLYISGDPVVQSGTATIQASGQMQYSLSATAIPASLAFTTDAQEVWSFVSGGVTASVTRAAYLVRNELAPAITADSMLKDYPWMIDLLTDEDRSGFLDRAWERITRDIIRKGHRPNLILDGWQLTDCHLSLALHKAFRAIATRNGNDPRYVELAAQHLADYQTAWSDVQWRYDWDEDGDGSERPGKPGEPAVLQTGTPATLQDTQYPWWV